MEVSTEVKMLDWLVQKEDFACWDYSITVLMRASWNHSVTGLMLVSR